MSLLNLTSTFALDRDSLMRIEYGLKRLKKGYFDNINNRACMFIVVFMVEKLMNDQTVKELKILLLA